MKRFVLCIAALALALSAGAQSIRPEWDVYFWGNLVNDEFDISQGVLAPSGTIGALRLSPYVGIGFGRGHKLKTGFDVMKDFGTANLKPTLEFAFWYQYNNDNGFMLAAGILPFSLMGGYNSSLLFSDASRFYDAHADGFLLRWQREKSNYEILFDWCGKFDETRREEFYVTTTGSGWVTPWLALCWEGMFHHYASSATVQGVVDDHILHPYVQFEFSPLLPMDRLELSLGGVAGYQMDRRNNDRRLPLGAMATVDARKWGFGVRNTFYYGQNQMPFYHTKDAAGEEFGANLYMRSSWWQIRLDGQAGLYDRLEAYWMKSLNDYVELGVHAVFHFDYLGLLGFQQILQAKVNLEALSFRKR